MNRRLYSRSVQIILENQSEWGSYVASPAFPTYNYCWLRDGSFIAHAMDTAGEFASAEAFFRWVGNTLNQYRGKVEDIRHSLQAGLPIGKDDVLHTRYTLDGKEVTVDSTWGNFQIDGYGTWLWALAEHVRLSGSTRLLSELAEPIQLTLSYLDLAWKLPNYDCWEEHPEYLHPYSLATVYAGFNSIASLISAGQMIASPLPVDQLALEVKDFILKYGVENGRLVKHIWPEQNGASPRPVTQTCVDSSLIGLAVPYAVLPLEHPVMQATLQAIEADIHRPGGGIYRYKADVYYGGGEWLLLSAWLGWYYAQVGQKAKAEALLEWVESKAGANDFMPEQVNDFTLAPEHYEPWCQKWGKVASPLLWSHAMYIILVNALNNGSSK